MDHNQNNKGLFNDFSPVSAEEWEEKIRKDLKTDDLSRLTWMSPEGIGIRPFYTGKDLEGIDHLETLPGEFPYVRGRLSNGRTWFIRQEVDVDDFSDANKESLKILMKGVTSLNFKLKTAAPPAKEDLEKLCENIYAEAIEINFSCRGCESGVIRYLEELLIKYNRDLSVITGSLDWDPVGDLVLNGRFPEGEQKAFEKTKKLIESSRKLPLFRVITVHAGNFHEAGGTAVQQIAYGLAQGVAYLTRLSDLGLSIDQVAPKIGFGFSAGSDYFMEIAGLRAARLLWAQIVKAYGPGNDENARMHTHVATSAWNKTVYDPYTNLLRTTTETMSAILGGADSITVLPFDQWRSEPGPFSKRLARNQQLLLMEESYLDKVADPAAGSYFIEHLTRSLAEQSWKLFLEVQEDGGFIEAFRTGSIQQKIKESATQRKSRLARGVRALLGTNRYPDFTEKFGGQPDQHEAKSKQEHDMEAEPLERFRGAEPFEALRMKTDAYAVKNKRPEMFTLPLGNLAMRRARSQFACNFFACAGFSVTDNTGFPSVEKAVEACAATAPDIAVVCSSDEEYGQYIPELYKHLNDKTLLVVAGDPSKLSDEVRKSGIPYFIHRKSNLLELLTELQTRLGIE